MTTQDKIDILKDYIYLKEKTHKAEKVEQYNSYINAKQWLAELEQSNNGDNIDNWSNRELFDYCLNNGLFVCKYNQNEYEFQWDNLSGRKIMLQIINTFKSQK